MRKSPVMLAGAVLVPPASLSTSDNIGGFTPDKIPPLIGNRSVFFLSNWQKTGALCGHWALPRRPPLFMKFNPITL